jgi:hypothetical protein
MLVVSAADPIDRLPPLGEYTENFWVAESYPGKSGLVVDAV